MAPRKKEPQALWRCTDGHVMTEDGKTFSACETLQLANLMVLHYSDIVAAARVEQRSLERQADLRAIKRWDIQVPA